MSAADSLSAARVSYMVRLSCGHEGRYPADCHPYEGAVLHCSVCCTLQRSVLVFDRREVGSD